MKRLDIIIMILLAMLFGFVFGTWAEETKGVSVVCDQIGYLSTECKDVKVLPMEFKDKDVALAKAGQEVTVNDEDTIVIVGEKVDEEQINDVVVQYKWEEDYGL